jgi:hypothetical protein
LAIAELAGGEGSEQAQKAAEQLSRSRAIPRRPATYTRCSSQFPDPMWPVSLATGYRERIIVS